MKFFMYTQVTLKCYTYSSKYQYQCQVQVLSPVFSMYLNLGLESARVCLEQQQDVSRHRRFLRRLGGDGEGEGAHGSSLRERVSKGRAAK